jgi:hypothetical protein
VSKHDEQQYGEQHPDEQPGDDGGTDPKVAAALERLEGLAARPPAEHVEVYEDVHRVLQESLAEAQGDRPER